MTESAPIQRQGYILRQLEAAVPADAYLRNCVDVPRFLALCRECPNYEHRWSCPPFSFDPMDIWTGYDTLRLVARQLIFTPGFRAGDALAALETEKALFTEDLMVLERSVPGSRMLSPGKCQLCPGGCSRGAGQPCRRPERLRCSIEALGGNVSRTVEDYLGKSLLWMTGDTAPEYLMLVGGLLLNRSRETPG